MLGLCLEKGTVKLMLSEVRSGEKKPYETPILHEYGDLGDLTLGGNGTNMDNGTGGGMSSTKN
jgi:hypothetical protein